MNKAVIVRIEASMDDGDERVHLFKFFPSPITKDEATDEIEAMLKNTSLERQFQIFGLDAKYSYPDEEHPCSDALPHNTLVEITLPYCLHLPNGITFDVALPNAPSLALVVCRKEWTKRAEGSSDADLFARDRITYLAPSALNLPVFPVKPSTGPEPDCTGTNIERSRDGVGYFRYSRLRIFFDTHYERIESKSGKTFDRAKRETVDLAIAVVNRILDVYRTVTKESHVQRVGSVYVTDLYFADHNIGIHGAHFDHGIGNAVMNRPEQEIEQIAAQLKGGDDISVPDLLFLDAEASLHANRLVLTVVHAFQALEIFLDDFLRTRLAANGVDPATITKEMTRCWQTQARLKDLLKEVTGHSLTEVPSIWDPFCTAYDQIRNRLIHAAKAVDYPTAERTLRICHDVVGWVSLL